MAGISRSRRSFSKRSLAAIAVAVMALLFGFTSSFSAATNVHPSVLQWSNNNPGQPVPVIVRGSDTDSLVASVEAAGGSVEREQS